MTTSPNFPLDSLGPLWDIHSLALENRRFMLNSGVNMPIMTAKADIACDGARLLADASPGAPSYGDIFTLDPAYR